MGSMTYDDEDTTTRLCTIGGSEEIEKKKGQMG